MHAMHISISSIPDAHTSCNPQMKLPQSAQSRMRAQLSSVKAAHMAAHLAVILIVDASKCERHRHADQPPPPDTATLTYCADAV
jgi:hypothetical protein